jgi:hypothetical protein
MDGDLIAWAAAQPEGSFAQNLYAAIMAGAETVRTSTGDMVTYRSQSDMITALRGLYMAAQSAQQRRPRSAIARVGTSW